MVAARFMSTSASGGKARKGAIARFDGELDDDQRRRLAEIAERTPMTLMQGLAITTTLSNIPKGVVTMFCKNPFAE